MNKTYLALGDSYTIGEAVAPEESFPRQLVNLLHGFDEPLIIAKTGWTSAELTAAIRYAETGLRYDLVTLLIGVNNQYRGLSLDDYQSEFELLLQTAIAFTVNQPDRVYVVSIPDWSATPFAHNLDRYTIRKTIDKFNEVNKAISEKYGAFYIEITVASRDALHDKTLVASDNLHPSAHEYAKWAAKLAEAIMENPKFA
jgi:lysophospholipase L1-like esterase